MKPGRPRAYLKRFFLSRQGWARDGWKAVVLVVVLGLTLHQLFQLFQSRQLDQKLPGLFAQARIVALGPPEFKDSAELVQLGEALFFDKILSGNRNISCATCHHPTLSSSDAGSFSIGQGGKGLGAHRQLYSAETTLRNAPALFNLGYNDIPNLFWDGRVEMTSGLEKKIRAPARELSTGSADAIPNLINSLESALEVQVMIPVTDFAEMRGTLGQNELADAPSKAVVWALLMKRLVGTASSPTTPVWDEYRALFQAAFPNKKVPEDLQYTDAAKALAAFIRQTFRATETPLDHYLRGETWALSLQEKRGAELFLGKARCAECHSGRHLSNFEYAVLAVPQIGPGNVMSAWDEGGTYTRGVSLNTTDDFGRYGVTHEPEDRFKFRVPPLRQVGITGPWMHNGAFVRLDTTLDHILDPQKSLQHYSGEGIERKEFLKHLTKNKQLDADRLSQIDPRVQISSRLSSSERQDLLTFLTHSLTDPKALSGSAVQIPTRVPSGIDPRD
jgi:cytochrome c peroxidase